MLAKQLLEVVDRQPDSIAIVDPMHGSISYKDLWRYIASTAKAVDQKFHDNEYIGIVADQDAFALIMSMSVMLSGRTIVPIDPRHDSRLIKELLHPFTSILLTNDKTLQANTTLDVFLVNDVVSIDDTAYSFSHADSKAYVLHTSGTTGMPKAVSAQQKALYEVASALIDRYYISSDSKVLQFAYLSFDSSLIEIWSTLLAGGTIVVPGERIREDMYGSIEQMLLDGFVNTATLPSAVAANISTEAISHFSTLVLAGDELSSDLANKLKPYVNHLINAYGPTEAIICASTYEIMTPIPPRIPIGKPLPGMRINVSSKGELLLYSTYLANGYENNTTLTDSKFIKDSTGDRYYRSGDIGAQIDDNCFEFLGRIDHQIKINGQRVELEGVEAAIRSITHIDRLVVVMHEEHLVCVYESAHTSLEPHQINKELKSVQPAYALPQKYIRVNDIALDRNGKIDRKNVVNYIKDFSSAATYTISSDILNELISTWSHVLKIQTAQITPETTFFELGGDSLSALKLVSELNNQFNTSLKLSEIIKNPATPESMAAVIMSNKGSI